MKLSIAVKYDSPYPASLAILMRGDVPITRFALTRPINKNYSVILDLPDSLVADIDNDFSVVACEGIEILNISKILYEEQLLCFYDGKCDKFFIQDFNAIKGSK